MRRVMCHNSPTSDNFSGVHVGLSASHDVGIRRDKDNNVLGIYIRSLAAINSDLSYPSQPASPATLRRTISDSFAVAVWFSLSTVLISGNGSPVSGFDWRDRGGSSEVDCLSIGVSYQQMLETTFLIMKTNHFQSVISSKIVVTQLYAPAESSQ